LPAFSFAASIPPFLEPISLLIRAQNYLRRSGVAYGATVAAFGHDLAESAGIIVPSL
jgi:hypothetical protein